MRSIHALLISGLAAAPQIADACGGSPPPPEPCVVTYACDFATPKTHILPSQSATAASGQMSLAKFPGFVFQETYNPDNQTCPTSTASLELFADCTDLIGKPSSELTTTFEESFPVEDLQEGINHLDLVLEWEFWDEGSFGDPGTLESGYCQVWGTLLVEGPTGLTSVDCGNQTKICFDEEVIDSNGVSHPRVELTNISLTTQAEGGAQLAKPGAPIKSTYTLTNWSDEPFDGVFTVGSNNSNNTVVFEPDSENDVGYTYTLSEGEGDDFPLEIVPDKGEYDPCFPLPTPAASIDPSGSIAVNLKAGETKTIQTYTRSWGNCANGSCSGIGASVSGEFESGIPLNGCAGGLVVVSDGDGDGAECADGGLPSTVIPCDDDAPEGDVCYEQLALLVPSHSTAGLRLQGMNNGTDLVVFLDGTDASSGSATHETDVHNINDTLGRILEDIHLGSAPSAGTTIELISTFKAQAGNAEGLALITELSIGDKYSPDETVAHSFIGLGEVVVAGNPNAMFQLQLQESIWAVDPVNGQSVEVPIESGGFEVVDDDHYTVTIRFAVPDSEAVSYILTHDIRAFALTEFEIDCSDETDNDNDGLIDCDDDDCAEHPACSEDTGPGQTDSGDVDPSDDSGEEEGCGCSSQPNPSSGILGLFMVALVLCRRKNQ
jgi:MYXO-CTERM domain-containing protein